MVLYDLGAIAAAHSSNSSSSSASNSSHSTKYSPVDIDGQLAEAGYRVRSSELRQVAWQLERLETVMVNAPSANISRLTSDAVVHYNPTDLASWVDSLLTELTPLGPEYSSSSSTITALSSPPTTVSYSDPFGSVAAIPAAASAAMVTNSMDHAFAAGHDSRWTDQVTEEHHQQRLGLVQQQQYHHQQLYTTTTSPNPMTVIPDVEEDSGIKLVHMLMTCADSIQSGEISIAGSLIEEMKRLITRVNTESGIGKVAGYFIDALTRRLYQPQTCNARTCIGFEHEILYHHFYEASPCLKFAHFTANQAILEAFEGQDDVHVIDFDLRQGLQWPPLIQALALRQGGGPLLTITGIGPPSTDGRDSLREVGMKLAELARSVNVRFNFRGVVASKLEDIKPWMLQVRSEETVAVNSIMQLHRLLGPFSSSSSSNLDQINSGIDPVLDWIRELNPKIVAVVEQEANHNKPGFLDRFTEALYYYSTVFDSLEACTVQPEKALAEIYIQREICNIVCCEGWARVERHEPLNSWRTRLGRAGFKPLHLGSNAFRQASMLLTLFSAEGYCVEENDGCLTLGWHGRPLIAASAWQVKDMLCSSSPESS